ncbi:MAG: efflux RND transporter periplasmic adaptor subunit [Planctomycetota bacterium]
MKGTQQLYDSNYVAETELKSDQLDVQSLEIQKEQAETAKALYVKYEFPKQVVTLLSACHESKRELERVEAGARSKLAQAQAEYDKEQAKYALQVQELKHEKEQLEACTIRAPAPGEVVYASSMGSRWERRSRPIELGASISERQSIISIPDPCVMKVEVRIHETWIDKIQPGQKARINVAAFPEESMTGAVLKKAPMADPEEWLNPDLKVYSTDVKINGTHEQLKTGMTAKVEIIVEELKDVISAPIQSVVNVEGRKVCYAATDEGPQQRQVETGAFNENFVEIKSGLSEGEKVLLNPPRRVESEAGQE